MTSPRTPAADRSDTPVIAFEPSGGESDSVFVAALDQLAALAARTGAAMLVPVDARSERLSRPIVDAMARHGVAVLPVIVLDGAAAQQPSDGAGAIAGGLLAALTSTCPPVEWDGSRCAGIDAPPGFAVDDARSTLSAALEAPGLHVRMGWLRRRALHLPLPTGVDFAIDWPPYGLPPGSAPEDVDYALTAADIARRHAGESPMAPSVVWSPAPLIALADTAIRMTGVSSIKIAYAIDAARRFVRNRAGHGVPFWVLRVAFDPGAPADVDSLAELAAALRGAHQASGAMESVADRLGLPDGSTARIAVVVHLYYPELWDELAVSITTLPETCDVFVSCPRRARDAVERIVRQRFPHAVVFGVSNRGRDVLPFLHWLRTTGVDRYEYVLKLHSKKSVHVADPTLVPFGSGDTWRRQVLDGLVGEDHHACALIRSLDARPDVGIVAAAGLLYDQLTWRGATGDLVESLCAGLGLTDRVCGGFPAGTMFWARIAALAPLAGASAQLLDFEREAGQVDGALHHAYERVFPLVAAKCGYRTVDSAQLLA